MQTNIVEPTSAISHSSARREWSFLQRHGILIVALSPLIPNVIGSVFNVLYNRYQIEPLLVGDQMDRFYACALWYNLIVYPIGIYILIFPLIRIKPLHRALIAGEIVDPEQLETAQLKLVNMPWWFLWVASVCWLMCIPVFPAALATSADPVSSEVNIHLVTSFLIASMIAVTHTFFAVEMGIQKALFPVFFQHRDPAAVPGGRPLDIIERSVMWAISAVVCPVISLILILLVPDAQHNAPLFGIAVACVAIAFGLTTSWMLGWFVATPVRHLHRAAMRVDIGELDVRIDLQRADDFGILIRRFNCMIEGLQEREHLQETFGRHVGEEAARQIMAQGDTLSGREDVISVMFVDVRNFTQHSSSHSPEQVVTALNVFFRKAVAEVEGHGGMVNKFLGDGFMALFGIGPDSDNHAVQAVEAGKAMLACVEESADEFAAVGWPELSIGIGVNTGPAVVGSIGSPKRQEYTAIGDAVNVAARVESLTKAVGHCFVITEATRQMLPDTVSLTPLPPQSVKGKSKPLCVYGVEQT